MGLGNFPLRKLPPGKFLLENSQKEISHVGKLPLGKAPCGKVPSRKLPTERYP